MATQRYPLSVIIITHNEERNIGECLQSVHWADDIVVVDAQSSDETVKLTKKFIERVFVVEWKGYAEAKIFALQHAGHEWVLWLDADERVTSELASEIQSVVSGRIVPHVAYEVGRRAYFLGRWIQHCGWYPGYVTRLFMKSKAQFVSSRVHEHLDVQGSIGRLRSDVLHHTDENLFHYFSKFNRYTTLAAQDLYDDGREFSLRNLIINPAYLLFKMYILRLGFLDGMHGFILSLLSSAYVFTKYAKLWELKRSQRNE